MYWTWIKNRGNRIRKGKVKGTSEEKDMFAHFVLSSTSSIYDGFIALLAATNFFLS